MYLVRIFLSFFYLQLPFTLLTDDERQFLTQAHLDVVEPDDDDQADETEVDVEPETNENVRIDEGVVNSKDLEPASCQQNTVLEENTNQTVEVKEDGKVDEQNITFEGNNYRNFKM